MYLRRRLLSLLRDARNLAPPAARLATAPSPRTFSSLPPAASSASGSSGGNFSNKGGSAYGAMLIGPAAVFLGLSSNTVLALDDSVAPAATSEQSEANDSGLCRVEDGPVISNEQALSQQRKGNEAEALIRESIRTMEEAGLGESPMCLEKMNLLSTELLNSGRLAEAEKLQRKILHIMELSEGWDSLYTTRAAANLSVILQSIGNFKESEEILERCLAVRRKILSEDHFEVAGILERLAMLTLIKIIIDLEVNNHLSSSDLVKAKQLVNDSIRITEAILNPSRENQEKLESTIAMEGEKIEATKVLLRALEVVVYLEGARKSPGLLERVLRLPLEFLKELGIHIKHNSEKFGYERAEQALRRCISLYNEPHTRDIVSKAIRQDYMSLLSRIVKIVQSHPVLRNEPQMQVLLWESQQIMKELWTA